MVTESQTWIRNDESILAEELRQRNLSHANLVQHEVHPKRTIYSRFIKRILDVVISFPAVLVSLPINAIIALITLKDVGRPLFYCQKRIGENGRPFTLVKFRNMTNEKDENGELLPPAQRVTDSGRVLRKHSLDELLNFWSVLKGDMSIIGPRPLPVQYSDRLSDRHLQRQAVKPGLLCPITKEFKELYPFPEPFSRYQAQFETDIWYVENISFFIDVKLFVLLIKETFDMERRSRNADSASPFIGYDDDAFAISRKVFEEKYREEG